MKDILIELGKWAIVLASGVFWACAILLFFSDRIIFTFISLCWCGRELWRWQRKID